MDAVNENYFLHVIYVLISQAIIIIHILYTIFYPYPIIIN